MANNIPAIAEKVKFWEEQDKINQAVIPRVIEMNDSLKMLASQLGTFDTKIAESESRIQNRFDTKLDSLTSRISTVETKISESESRIQNRVDHKLEILASQINSFDTKIAEFESLIQNKLKEQNRAPKLDRVISISAIIISVLSLLIALLK